MKWAPRPSQLLGYPLQQPIFILIIYPLFCEIKIYVFFKLTFCFFLISTLDFLRDPKHMGLQVIA